MCSQSSELWKGYGRRSEAPEYVFEETVKEQTTVEEVAEAEIAFEENAEQVENYFQR